MKEQKLENKAENDKKMPEANCARTLETCGEERIKRGTCVDISARKKLLACDESISPTRLSEMVNKEINDSIKRINNSIKDAMQTLVKCSMVSKMQEEKKPILSLLKEPMPGVCQSYVLEEHCKKSPNVCINRQTTSHASQRCNTLSTYDNSYLCTKMDENVMPLSVKNEVSSEKKSKKHSKAANNANTDNRRMTGNVNIYICSEANNNEQSRKKLKSQFDTDTSSNTVTEQSNSRSTSTTSSCKLINSIKEKRKKLLIQQSPNLIHNKSNDDNTVCDNSILRRRISRKELSEAGAKEEADVKVSAGNVWRKNTTSSTKDSSYSKDKNGIDLQQNSSYSTVPCSSFSACDNTKHPQSWLTIYPSEAKTRLNDSNAFLSRTICTNTEQKNDRKNNVRDNVLSDDNEYTVCHAIDDSKWLPKSIYTDCATYSEDPEERYADNKYRNKIFQGSIINQNDVQKKQMGYKSWQRSVGNCQREQVVRKCSICSCITEEEEDYCKGIDRVKNEFPENVCSVAECPEKISIRQTSSKKLNESTNVCEESFSAPGRCFKNNLAKCSRSICGAKFGNSEELLKITRVCKEFVIEEPSEDITVCKTMFDESNGLAEEVIAYRTARAFPDSKDTPKKTVCKKTPDSNFISQDDANRLPSSDAKAKHVEEDLNSLNLNYPKENAENKKITKLNNKYDNNALDNFTRQQSANVEQHEQMKETLNDQSKNLYQDPVEDCKDFKSLLKNVNSTTRVQLYDHSNLVSNSNIKETSKTLVNKPRMELFNQSMRNHSQQLNNLTQNLASNKNNQLEEKMQENSEKEEERQNISKEMEITEEKQKEPLFHRSFKKLIDVIKRGKTLVANKIEVGKIEAKKAIIDVKRDNEKPEINFQTENKTIDIKNQQKITKIMSVPMKPQTEIASKGKKIDIQRTDQTMPKLLRIVAMKKSHALPTTVTTDSKPQKSEVAFVPAEIITITHVDQEEIPEEVILQEHIPAEITEEIKANDSITPEISIAAIETSVEDTPKDVAYEYKIPKDIRDETTEIDVTYSQKKPEEESQKPILCKCGPPSDPSARSCSIARRTKDYLPCPQKKLKMEPQKFMFCKRELAFNSNNYSCSIVKCTKCNKINKMGPCKDNRFEPYHLSTIQCETDPKNYSKISKPKFREVSPLKINPYTCTNCCKERKCGKTAVCGHSYEKEYRYRWCGSQASCINCGRSRNQCCCATFALVKCHKIKEGCNRKRTMICLYCDNPQDKCTCRVPIGKCSHCGLPSDVCNSRDEGHARDYEQIAGRPDEYRTIHVTSWKPKKEITKYFARNFEDHRSYSTGKCPCYEKRRPEELPYQRLSTFSEVMNELQQKISEPVCCARCWKNPCCCGWLVDQDKRKEEKKVESHVKHAEIERSPRNRNNCRCSSRPRNERKSNIQKSIPIRHIGCICRLKPCRCRKDRFNCKKPLAKCYYCKNLPCTCITVK